MVLPQNNQTKGIVTRNNRCKLIINEPTNNPILTLICGIPMISHLSKTHKPTIAVFTICLADMRQEGCVIKHTDHIVQLAQIRFATPIWLHSLHTNTRHWGLKSHSTVLAHMVTVIELSKPSLVHVSTPTSWAQYLPEAQLMHNRQIQAMRHPKRICH